LPSGWRCSPRPFVILEILFPMVDKVALVGSEGEVSDGGVEA
jgi:hypothetical protein